MRAALQKYGIDGIWHFTDNSNVQSIRNHGLLSLAESRSRGLPIPRHGGNDWSHNADAQKQVDRYVHLAFLDNHPMLYRAKGDKRITEPVWLKISIEVLDVPGVFYTMDVSNKTGVSLLTAGEAIKMLDFEVLFSYTNWADPIIQNRRKDALKSEVLIPTSIPSNMILEIKNG